MQYRSMLWVLPAQARLTEIQKAFALQSHNAGACSVSAVQSEKLSHSMSMFLVFAWNAVALVPLTERSMMRMLTLWQGEGPH